MSSVSSSSARADHVVCIICNNPAAIYCCVCEKYYCDIDNVNFHNSNPDDLGGHMRLRLRVAPQVSSEPVHAPPPPSPLIQRLTPASPEERRNQEIIKEVTEEEEPDSEAKHIGEGIIQGAEAFGKGILGGITGVVMDPIKGGKEDGAAGAIKGTVTGIGNVAIKPIRGTGELLSRAAEGLRNTPTAIFSDEVETKQKTEVTHVGEGLLVGTKSLGKGIIDGITGVVMDPIRGAEKDGVPGFFIGVSKGLVGLAFKPVAGAIDFVAKPIEGIANTPGTIADKIEEISQKKKSEQGET